MSGIERYSKYISITEHVIVGSLALAALNILVQDGVSGVSPTNCYLKRPVSERLISIFYRCNAFLSSPEILCAFCASFPP